MSEAFAGATSKFGSGLTFFSDAVAATAVAIKDTQGQIYFLDLVNGSAATTYLQIFFQPAAKVTVGTTPADMTINVPTNAAAGFTRTLALTVPVGLFAKAGGTGSGLSCAATTTATGSTAASMSVMAIYK